MKESNSEKYLGNVITTGMNCNQLISSWANAGIGNVSQIMSILKDVTLGYH